MPRQTSKCVRLAAAMVLAGLGCCASALADSSPAIIFIPWPDERQHGELYGSTIFEKRSQNANNSNSSTELSIYEADVRFRLDAQDTNRMTFGADIAKVSISSTDPLLKDRHELMDQAFSLGFKVLDLDEEWEVDILAGIGYSGSNPYSDPQSIYGKGALVFNRKIDPQTNLFFLLDYNGNRPAFPDIPLPIVAYQHVEGDAFSYTIGLPVAAIHWQPWDWLTLDLSAIPPSSLNANAKARVMEQLFLYAALESREYAFRVDHEDQYQRIFFDQRLIEAGVLFSPFQAMELQIGGGYAFDQHFNRGWESYNADTILRVKSTPYVRMQFTFYF